MEPSFWSWEKPDERPQGPHVLEPAMEPSFWSWEKLATLAEYERELITAAMEPSSWSWEK